MGLRLEYIKFIEGVIGDPRGLSMLELGNQIVRDDVNSRFSTGKKYWLNRGCHHVSIDKNGKDGALNHDLSKPFDLNEKFDIVTDIGVSCYIKGREMCHRNMYAHCRDGGFIVQILPFLGSKWTAEWYTTIDYPEAFAANYAGNIINTEMINSKFGKQMAFAFMKSKCGDKLYHGE